MLPLILVYFDKLNSEVCDVKYSASILLGHISIRLLSMKCVFTVDNDSGEVIRVFFFNTHTPHCIKVIELLQYMTFYYLNSKRY